MQVKVLGAAKEVGRSVFQVNCDGTSLLLDYGVLVWKTRNSAGISIFSKSKRYDAIIITHAHLDHSGNVPSLFVSGNTDVYATPPTFDLSRLLIEDMLKIQKMLSHLDFLSLNKMMRNAKEIKFREKITKEMHLLN